MYEANIKEDLVANFLEVGVFITLLYLAHNRVYVRLCNVLFTKIHLFKNIDIILCCIIYYSIYYYTKNHNKNIVLIEFLVFRKYFSLILNIFFGRL